MGSIKRFGLTILLSILALSGSLSFLWLLTLCGFTHESLVKSQGSAPLVQYLSALATTGDFWRALLFFLMSVLSVTCVVILIRRDRKRRSAEIEQEKICENETEWEQQP